jgi:hypothetical protein
MELTVYRELFVGLHVWARGPPASLRIGNSNDQIRAEYFRLKIRLSASANPRSPGKVEMTFLAGFYDFQCF